MKIIFRNKLFWDNSKRNAWNKWKSLTFNVTPTHNIKSSNVHSKLKLQAAFFRWYRKIEQQKSKDMIKTIEIVASESDKNNLELLQMLSDTQAQRDSIKRNYELLQDQFSSYIDESEDKIQNLASIAERKAFEESKEFIQELQASEILYRLKSYISRRSQFLKRRSLRKWFKISKLPESLTSLSLSNSYDSLLPLSKMSTVVESPISIVKYSANTIPSISKSPYISRENSSVSFELGNKSPIVKSHLPPRPSINKKLS